VDVPPPPPPFDWHVVICQGTSCTEKGQGAPARALRNAIFGAGLAARIRTTRATCLNLCGLAPNLVVYAAGPRPGAPAGGTWYCGVTPAAAERIVTEHLAGARVVTDLAFRWDHPAAAP
jgi:(2Fe-2S) ferredoxin